MKRQKKFLPLLMMTLLAVFAFAGCSSSDDSATSTSDSASSTTESATDEDDTDTDTSANESTIMIGQITSLDATSLTLDLYESNSDVSTVSDIDTADLEETGNAETVAIQDDVVVRSLSNGVTQTAAVDNLAVGDMVAITDDDGQIITILEADTGAAAASGTTTDSTSGTDAAADDSASTTGTDSGTASVTVE